MLHLSMRSLSACLILLLHSLCHDPVQAEDDSEVCQYGAEELESKFTTLHDAFEDATSKQQLVFLFDRSQSVVGRNLAKQQQTDTAKALVRYLVSEGLVFVHSDYTQVSVITFSATNLFVVEGADSACGMAKGITDGLEGESGTKTFLTTALTSVKSLFDKHKSSNKVVFVFYDGDSNESPTNVTAALDALRGQDVKLFSIGLTGGWMTTSAKELLVKALATDETYYYICSNDLFDKIENETLTTTEESIDVFKGEYKKPPDIILW